MWTRLGTASSPCESLVGRQKAKAVTTKGPRQWAAAGRALFSRQADFSPVPVEQRPIFAATQPIPRIAGQETNALTPLAPQGNRVLNEQMSDAKTISLKSPILEGSASSE